MESAPESSASTPRLEGGWGQFDWQEQFMALSLQFDEGL